MPLFYFHSNAGVCYRIEFVRGYIGCGILLGVVAEDGSRGEQITNCASGITSGEVCIV